MLTREDVERIVENVLKDLKIKVREVDFTDPNSRMVTLFYRDREISRDYFDVADKPEYGG